MAKGEVKLNGKPLQEGDGAAISEEKSLELTGIEDAEVPVVRPSRNQGSQKKRGASLSSSRPFCFY